MPKYSIIVPVFNRPDEVDELLESLTTQTFQDFDIILVEDGSSKPCKDVADKYSDKLDIHYYAKENSGPGPSRNYGVERSESEYVIILDSDVVLPDGYMAAVEKSLAEEPCDAFGGPDSAHDSFTDMQKAISYSMTSFFTTGGIRGGKAKLDKFHPRSYNLGVKRHVYNALGGFSNMKRFIKACFSEGGTIETRMRKAKRKFIRIEMLVVRKEYQKQGFMRQMLDYTYKLADSRNVPVILDTDDKDKSQRYQHLGMKLDRIRTGGERFHMYDLIREA